MSNNVIHQAHDRLNCDATGKLLAKKRRARQKQNSGLAFWCKECRSEHVMSWQAVYDMAAFELRQMSAPDFTEAA